MEKHKNELKLIPVAVALGYIPLLVRLHTYDSHFEDFDWFPAWEDGTMYDFFLYFKAVAVIITAAVMLFILLYDMVKRKKSPVVRSLTYLMLLGYLLFVLISGVLSKYRMTAFAGSAESFESVPVILSYGIIFIYTYTYVRDRESLKSVLKISLPGFAVAGITGLLQFFGADPFKSALFKIFTVPARYADLRDSLAFTFRPGEVYATLYNSNYIAQYFGFGLFFGLSLMIFNKISRARLAGAVVFLMSLLAIIGSHSRTGYIAVIISLMIFLFLAPYYSESKAAKLCRIASIVSAAAIVIMIPVLYFMGEMPTILHKAGFLREGETDHLIKDVKTGKDGVQIRLRDETILFSYETDGTELVIDMKDAEGMEPEYELSEDMTGYILKDERFEGMKLYPVYVEDRVCLCAEVDERKLVFFDAGEGEGYLYYNKAGKFADFKHYDRSSFFSDTLFSDRGLLWNNCLKLLPEKIITGSGAGTFVYIYPNDDDYYRLYDDTGYNFYDVKAHSLYFQQFIENGGIAFLFFLIFYISFVIRALKSKEPLVFAILAGSFCYMLCSLTVDSNVNTAPVFWVLTGTVANFSYL